MYKRTIKYHKSVASISSLTSPTISVSLLLWLIIVILYGHLLTVLWYSIWRVIHLSVGRVIHLTVWWLHRRCIHWLVLWRIHLLTRPLWFLFFLVYWHNNTLSIIVCLTSISASQAIFDNRIQFLKTYLRTYKIYITFE